MPDLSLEQESRAALPPGARICGVDEAGRGPLAGPVVAAAAILDPTALPESLRLGLNDSKKLSAKKRTALLQVLQGEAGVWLGLGLATVEEIDRLNILRATHLAMERAVLALPGLPPALALIDGNQAPRAFPCPTRCVVKGDSLSLSIAAASILAKQHRDGLMQALAQDFPGYGWDRNAGYGTEEHRTALRRLGPTPHHRKSFAPIGDLFAGMG